MPKDWKSDALSYIDTGFGNFYFFPNFVIGEWETGQATAEQVDQLRVLFEGQFEQQPYGYIGNRINSHSVDVARIRGVLRNTPNLKAVCFVVYSGIGKRTALLEQKAYDSHDLELFTDLHLAIDWMRKEMQRIASEEKAL